ncbi:TerB family tellurite resistance protein [Psychrobium sp. MM17-31]|uniref:tellurite resistance TerB family protein n=1 Tax=Psychrobium sp. MM17-31 TaxID=2917758 RepID=UPI001EF67DE7|nr:TerB family tellurite resistance protein [Psychrobium sp. MM17-31]MCG7530357.1 TerB family tellurite resistance protein [Psychrobium sp. MM17-31]
MFKSLAQLFSHVNQQAPAPVVGLELAMAVLLYEVAAADDCIKPAEENAMLALFKTSFSLDEYAAQAMLDEAKTHQHNAVSLQEFTHILRQHLDRPQRVHFLYELWQVANSDDDIDVNEEHIIRRISDLLYLNHSDFIQAKLKVIE